MKNLSEIVLGTHTDIFTEIIWRAVLIFICNRCSQNFCNTNSFFSFSISISSQVHCAPSRDADCGRLVPVPGHHHVCHRASGQRSQL